MAESKSMRSTFECLGVMLGDGAEHVMGDCPFCGKDNHFHVNVKTGQWDCKRCGENGNIITFMGRVAEKTFKETHSRDWLWLAQHRTKVTGSMVNPALPVQIFKNAHMGWTGSEWWIPVYSENGTVRDIRRWDGNSVKSTSGRTLQLWGMRELAKAEPGTTVWVCEGEWDGILLRWVLDMAGHSQDVVVAVPGAGVFKQEWAQHFKGMKVIFCYDNDQPGDDGSMKAGDLVRGLAASVRYLCWPETRESGWDLSDTICEDRAMGMGPSETLEVLNELISRTHRRASLTSPEDPRADEPDNRSTEIATYDEVLRTFEAWITMDQEFKDAIAVSLAVCLANDVPGDPLWVYLVGPAGSGKTLVLMAMQDSDRTKFYSTLTPASLVSGFNVSPDPSLLPELHGKTAIFKDGTELTSLHPDSKREVYGVLRGAFDGHVLKRFGNGVLREYRLHFNLMIGVTPIIHADNQSTMGERFVKFEMHDEFLSDAKVRRAVMNLAEEKQMQEELSDVCRRFLLREIDPTKLPPIPASAVERIVALAQLVAMLRAQVEREAFGDRDVKFRPSHEVGTRVAKQMAKMGQMLTYVFGTEQINERVMDVLVKVAFDTTVGFHTDIVTAIINEGNTGMTRQQMAKSARVPDTTLARKVQDLEQLGILEKMPARPTDHRPTLRGVQPAMWCVSDRVVDLWNRALGFGESSLPLEAAGGNGEVFEA